jgi:ABC-type multidrug transport system permease subunit
VPAVEREARVAVAVSGLRKRCGAIAARMSLFRFPLLFVSGVFLPVAAMLSWIKPEAYLLPLTHVVELLTTCVQSTPSLGLAWIPACVLGIFFSTACAVTAPAFRRFANR